jgi:DNA-binding NarL/FixJ family response regulator
MQIIVVDDHALVREGLAQVLSALDGTVEVHQAATVQEAIERVDALDTLDLALIDFALPDGDGLELIARFKQTHPTVVIAILSGIQDAALAQQTLAAGAVGFIPKSAPTAVLINALKLVLAGGLYVPPELGASARVAGVTEGLTERQLAILVRLALGKSNKTIAHDLGITEATVKAHVSAIFRALGVSNRTQAVRAAQARGLV